MRSMLQNRPHWKKKSFQEKLMTADLSISRFSDIRTCDLHWEGDIAGLVGNTSRNTLCFVSVCTENLDKMTLMNTVVLRTGTDVTI